MKAWGDAGISDHMRRGMRSLFVLFSLSKRKTHGYLLMKEFREKASKCRGAKKVGVGEFYATLDSLSAAGIVRSEWSREEGQRPKKVFSLTPRGRVVVKRAKEHFANVMGVFRGVVPELFSGSRRR